MNDKDILQTAKVKAAIFWSASEGAVLYAVPINLEGWKVEEHGAYRKLRLRPPPGQEGHVMVEITVMKGSGETTRKVHDLDVLESVEAVQEKMTETTEPTVWWASPWHNSPLPGLWRERRLLTGDDNRWMIQVWVAPKDVGGREEELEQNVQQVLKGLNFSAVTLGCEEDIPDFKGKIRITEDD